MIAPGLTAKEKEAVLNLLENLTHQLVHVHDLGHDDKVKLLDSLCEVKREFGVEECPQPT